jgi:hypothetical protein
MDAALDNINFPQLHDDCRREAAAFHRLRYSPLRGIIAAIDAIAIAITCPDSRAVQTRENIIIAKDSSQSLSKLAFRRRTKSCLSLPRTPVRHTTALRFYLHPFTDIY